MIVEAIVDWVFVGALERLRERSKLAFWLIILLLSSLIIGVLLWDFVL